MYKTTTTEPATFSPHAWGWTVSGKVLKLDAKVFPTRVGVDRLAGRLV